MKDYSNMSSQEFGFSLFGIKKAEVKSFLVEAEDAFKEMKKKVDSLESDLETLSKTSQENALKNYNLQKELDDKTDDLKKANDRVRKLEAELANIKNGGPAHKPQGGLGPKPQGGPKPAGAPHGGPKPAVAPQGGPKPQAAPTGAPKPQAAPQSAPKPQVAPQPQAAPKPEKPSTGGFKMAGSGGSSAPKSFRMAGLNNHQAPNPKPADDDDDDGVFSGEVEDNVKVSNAFRIGNDDDPDEGFDFI
ncbi:MAG: hypothetical protein IKQ71_08250 [Lachnospiraceae bacterium]|nr:hypothetical protein [Lachnospiraceae bacterium]